MPEKDFDELYEKYGKGRESPAEQQGATKRPAPKKMGIFEKIKMVLSRPSEFFETIKYEVGVKEAFKYFAILSLVILVIEIVRNYFITVSFLSAWGSVLSIIPGAAPGIVPNISDLFVYAAFVLPIFYYLINLVGSFISAGIIQFFARRLKGKGDYKSTYRALVYASTPSLLLGWIPFVGIIAILYGLYLAVKGISKAHDVSMLRSLGIILLPGIVFLIVIVVVGIVGALYVFDVFSIGGKFTVPCSPCFVGSDIGYVDHNEDELVIMIGSRDLDIGDAGTIQYIDLYEQGCKPGWKDCAVTIYYMVLEDDILHTASATLHQ